MSSCKHLLMSKGVRRKCVGVTDEVLREKGERKKKKKKKKKEGTFWSLEEVIGKKIRKKEKEKKRSKGTCGGEKKEGKKGKTEGNMVRVWRRKNDGKKREKKKKEMLSQSFHNKF